jgi:hypothetical protein
LKELNEVQKKIKEKGLNEDQIDPRFILDEDKRWEVMFRQ